MKLPFLNKRITPLIPITIITFIILLCLFLLVPPTTQISLVLVSFSVLYITLPLVFLLFFEIGTLLFKTRMHGFLFGMFMVSFLLLRLNDLRHPIFLVILAAFFITTEFFFAQSGKKEHQFKKLEKKSEE